MTLDSIIERLENDQLADRTLDYFIFCAFADYEGFNFWHPYEGHYYTSSVDAGISLADKVLPGSNRTIRKRYKTTSGKLDGHVFDAHVSGGDICEGATEALALCLAILKAKQMGVGE